MFFLFFTLFFCLFFAALYSFLAVVFTVHVSKMDSRCWRNTLRTEVKKACAEYFEKGIRGDSITNFAVSFSQIIYKEGLFLS